MTGDARARHRLDYSTPSRGRGAFGFLFWLPISFSGISFRSSDRIRVGLAAAVTEHVRASETERRKAPKGPRERLGLKPTAFHFFYYTRVGGAAWLITSS